MKTFRRRDALLAIGFVLPLLGACDATLWPKPPPVPALYTLDAGTLPPTGGAPAASSVARATIAVATPRAAPGADTAAIVYQRRAQQLEHFASARWVEPPAPMLAPLIVDALQGSGAFAAVVPASTAVAADFRLETELIRLQHDFTAAPSRVRMTLRAVLVDVARRKAVATQEFDVEEPAPSDDPYGGVVAAQRATQRILRELAGFAAQRR